MNKINYDLLKKVLSLKDMKNILGGSGDGGSGGNCGWRGATQVPCSIDWEGECYESCSSFNNNICVQSAREAWCFN